MTSPHSEYTQKSRMLGSYPHHCLRCEYDWTSKMPHPKVCSRCGARRWDKPPKKLPNGEALNRFLTMLSTAIPGTCLIWPYGKAGNGYGALGIDGKRDYAHHLAWIKTHGPIPEGQHVLHRCDNPSCFNPYCLFLGTESDNKDDQAFKWRTPIGEENPMAKLTEFDAIEIRRLYKRGVRGSGQLALAQRFGIHLVNIRKVVRGETWKHV
jgi:hypothetical protein